MSYCRNGRRAANTRSTSAPAFWAPSTIRWPFRIRRAKTFEVADLSLPKSVSEQAVHSRQEFLRRRGSALSQAVPERRARQHGRFTRAGMEDAAEPDRSECIRSVQGAGQAARPVTGAMPSGKARCLRGGWSRPEPVSLPPPDSTATPGTHTQRTTKDIATVCARRSTARCPFCSMI